MYIFLIQWLITAFLGFECPQDPPGLGPQGFKAYIKPNDCQRYFICVNEKPRLYNCGEGNAYNELINACDGIENVTTCDTGRNLQQQNNNNIRLG